MAEFILVVEGPADEKTATELANRIFLENIDWLEPYLLPSNVNWRGLQEETSCTHWRDVRHIIKQAKEDGVKIPRYIRGKGLNADGASVQKVLHLAGKLQETKPINAVILIRDLDNQPERRTGLLQGSAEFKNDFPEIQIVIGTADPKREAWVLNGFIAKNVEEQDKLTEHIREIKFDPCLEPERLRENTRRMPERSRNAKVVLELLTNGDSERQALCWQETDLAVLRERGINSGLTAYLAEVEQKLIPVINQA